MGEITEMTTYFERLLKWLDQCWCGLWNHRIDGTYASEFSGGIMRLRCWKCGHTTKGWKVGPSL